ncbi:MAG: permease-like cell division protein FtsX [Pseudomonadota bacterium]
MGGYFSRHLQVLVSSLGKLVGSPLASIMTILVIAITICLPAAFHLMVRNGLELTGGWDVAVDLSAYLEPGASIDSAKTIERLLSARADIERVELIDADAGLASFIADSGFGEALDSLDTNPLPHTLVITPIAGLGAEATALLQQEVAGLPDVDQVQRDTEWVATLQALLALIRRLVWVVGALLGVGLLVVIGNTIRLDIQNRRDEIEIMQLIGASHGFIRRPFLYTGLWYGLGGGLVALALLFGILAALGGPLQRFGSLYGSGGLTVTGPTLQEAAVIVGLGVSLGLIGSWIATARHMRSVDPI